MRERYSDHLTVGMRPVHTPYANPYLRLLCESLGRRGVRVLNLDEVALADCDIVHLHWPDRIVAHLSTRAAASGAAHLLKLLTQARSDGKPTVWTVHNLGPHEPRHSQLERMFWPLFTRSIDGFISLSEAGSTLADKRFPALRNVTRTVIPHGLYESCYEPWPAGQTDARSSTGITEGRPVFIHLGRLRPYKNIELLVRAFRSWRCETARLIIAGEPSSSAYGAELAKRVSGDYRIDLHLTHVSDADVGRFYTAADAAVLPFKEILNSGSLLLALTMGRPVLVPHTPVFAELAANVGTSWVRLYDDGRLDAATLDAFARSLDEPRRALQTDGLSWDEISESTEEFYRTLLRKRTTSRKSPRRRQATADRPE